MIEEEIYTHIAKGTVARSVLVGNKKGVFHFNWIETLEDKGPQAVSIVEFQDGSVQKIALKTVTFLDLPSK